MASEKGNGPPSYDTSLGQPSDLGNPSYPQQYPPSTTPYPTESSAPYPPSAPPPGYPGQDPQPYPTQEPAKAYPTQAGGYPPQGVPPGYPQQGGYPPQGAPPGYPQQGYPIQGAPPGYTPQGAAPGCTTQGVAYYPHAPSHATTTVITQQPGQVLIHAQFPPPDNLGLSIISMFCCFCIGIFALLKSLKSRELYRLGDHSGAQEMGMAARRMATIGIIVAICVYICIVILRIILQAAFA